MLRSVLPAAIALVLGGCIPPPSRPAESVSPTDVAQQMTVTRSAFASSDIYEGMTLRYDGYLDTRYEWPDTALYNFRLLVPKDGAARIWVLHVDHVYHGTGWVLFTRAHDDTAVEHHVFSGPTNVSCHDVTGSGCTFSQSVDVDMSPAFLNVHTPTGFRIQLSDATSGRTIVLNVPANVIQGFLASVPH